jgi:hypothetical protein
VQILPCLCHVGCTGLHAVRQHPMPAVKSAPRLRLAPATSAPGLGSTLPHLHRDTHPCHICAATGAHPCHICAGIVAAAPVASVHVGLPVS